MYRLKEIEGWRERRELMAGLGSVPRPARPKGVARSDTRPRVVRVPGGFTFVEDGSAIEGS